jgi:hypothetical protein
MHINIQAANKTNILRIVYRMDNTTNTHKKTKPSQCVHYEMTDVPSSHLGKFPSHIVAPS